jgi:hypothetical protein
MSYLARLLAIQLLLYESALTAASSGSATQTGNPTPSFGVIVAIICYIRRKKPIGGWLLYFFWSIFGGGLITAIFVAAGIKNYLPVSWEDHFLYSLFLASTVPAIAVEACLIVAAIALLRSRNWGWVMRIRWILAADIVAGIVAVLIDAKFFPDNLFFDVYGLIFPSIFLPYLFRSERVRRVFLNKDWDEEIKIASFADPKPQCGIIYTESELEAMRQHEPSLPSGEQQAVDGNPPSEETPGESPASEKVEPANAAAEAIVSSNGLITAGNAHRRWQGVLSALHATRTYLVALIAILTLAIAYYFVIALPANERAKLEFEREKFRALQSEKATREEDEKSQAELNQRLREACLDDAEKDYWDYVKLNGKPVPGKEGTYTASTFIWDAAAKRKKDAIAECQVRYGR